MKKQSSISRRLHTAVLAALVPILAMLSASAVGGTRLTDETQLDGTRELYWIASLNPSFRGSRVTGLEIQASCLFDEAQAHDRFRLHFSLNDMPAIGEGEAILLKIDDGPARELPARTAEDSPYRGAPAIELLSAEDTISQLIGAEEVTFGVRDAGGAIREETLGLGNYRFAPLDNVQA